MKKRTRRARSRGGGTGEKEYGSRRRTKQRGSRSSWGGESVVVVAQLIESYSSVRRTKQRGGGIVEALGAGGVAVGRERGEAVPGGPTDMARVCLVERIKTNI